MHIAVPDITHLPLPTLADETPEEEGSALAFLQELTAGETQPDPQPLATESVRLLVPVMPAIRLTVRLGLDDTQPSATGESPKGQIAPRADAPLAPPPSTQQQRAVFPATGQTAAPPVMPDAIVAPPADTPAHMFSHPNRLLALADRASAVPTDTETPPDSRAIDTGAPLPPPPGAPDMPVINGPVAPSTPPTTHQTFNVLSTSRPTGAPPTQGEVSLGLPANSKATNAKSEIKLDGPVAPHELVTQAPLAPEQADAAILQTNPGNPKAEAGELPLIQIQVAPRSASERQPASAQTMPHMPPMDAALYLESTHVDQLLLAALPESPTLSLQPSVQESALRLRWQAHPPIALETAALPPAGQAMGDTSMPSQPGGMKSTTHSAGLDQWGKTPVPDMPSRLPPATDAPTRPGLPDQPFTLDPRATKSGIPAGQPPVPDVARRLPPATDAPSPPDLPDQPPTLDPRATKGGTPAGQPPVPDVARLALPATHTPALPDPPDRTPTDDLQNAAGSIVSHSPMHKPQAPVGEPSPIRLDRDAAVATPANGKGIGRHLRSYSGQPDTSPLGETAGRSAVPKSHHAEQTMASQKHGAEGLPIAGKRPATYHEAANPDLAAPVPSPEIALKKTPTAADPLLTSSPATIVPSAPDAAQGQGPPASSDRPLALAFDVATASVAAPVERAQATAHSVPLKSPVQQASAALAARPGDQPGRIELTLAPETLGRLHFDMRPEGAGLAITLSAERPETLDLMRRHLPDLLAELKQAGVQAGTLSFGAWSEGRHPQTPANPRPEPDLASQTETTPLLATPHRRPTLVPSQGMDLRI